MILKHKVEDFIVKEVYDLEYFSHKSKKYSNKFYYYFLLTKTNYEQIRAILKIAQIFRKKEKHITFCGRKDKNAITKQLICIENAKRILIDKNVEFIKTYVKDLEIEYLGEFPTKLHIGENNSNTFKITARNITKNIQKQSKHFRNKYFMNLYGKQRFGFSDNSHIVGANIIKKDYQNAIYLMLTSINQKIENNSLNDFVDFMKNNDLNKKEVIKHAINNLPSKLDNLKPILEHLENNNKDFNGAIELISSREKIFFINAYQSFVFNETIKNIPFELGDKLFLINEEEHNNEEVNKYENSILEHNDIKRQDFSVFNIKLNQRDVFIKLDNLKYKILDDECFIGAKKIIFDFSLPSGSYATSIIEQLEHDIF